jgi:hypothetical protein
VRSNDGFLGRTRSGSVSGRRARVGAKSCMGGECLKCQEGVGSPRQPVPKGAKLDVSLFVIWNDLEAWKVG